MLQLPFATVADDLFSFDGLQTRLIGTHCRSCATEYFPRAPSCCNPACADKDIETIFLASAGTLYSWTYQTYRPPAPFEMDDWAPYAIGLVDIPGGLRILGMINGCATENIAIGMPMRVEARTLSTDATGTPKLTYCFIPDAPRKQAA